jgi:hypothetical protein
MTQTGTNGSGGVEQTIPWHLQEPFAALSPQVQ